MLDLNERQRAFVIAMVEMGGINYTRAAIAAGYGGGNYDAASVQGNRLAHDERILTAIHEESFRRLRSGTIMAVQTLLEIASDTASENKDRLKACEMILNRGGLPASTEHTIKVEHHDMTDQVKIERIRQLAIKQGIDPVKLLGSAGHTIDAEFTSIDPKCDKVEDDLGDIF